MCCDEDKSNGRLGNNAGGTRRLQSSSTRYGELFGHGDRSSSKALHREEHGCGQALP